jgi:hypothetical protein
LVQNKGRGVNFNILHQSDSLKNAITLGALLVEIPKLYESTMRKIDESNMSFWRALNHQHATGALSLIDRQRVKIWLKACYEVLGGLPIHPLVLGWMMAAIIRVCLGSATIAGLTAAGMIYPLVAAGGVNANLMVLSIGAGSLMFSHVNDTGFWLFKEYFNLTVKETLRSWSLMETIVSITGLAGVMILNQFL